jgi:hypothetical protein
VLSFLLSLTSLLHFLQAYMANVICPNKHQSDQDKFYKSHLLESETYIGGHVECLESGVFRSDLPTSFKLDPSAYEVSVSFKQLIRLTHRLRLYFLCSQVSFSPVRLFCRGAIPSGWNISNCANKMIYVPEYINAYCFVMKIIFLNRIHFQLMLAKAFSLSGPDSIFPS